MSNDAGASTDLVIPRQRPARKVNPELKLWVLSTVIFVGVIVLVEVLVRNEFISDFFLPTPTSVADSLFQLLGTARFWRHILVTVEEMLLGFAVALVIGVIIGSLVGMSRAAELIIAPYIACLQAVPKVAIAPIVILYLGFGISSKVAVAAAVAFYPIFVNVVEGVRTVDNRLLDYYQVQEASAWETFWTLRLPNAMPFLLSGMRVGMVFSILGAVVAEFVGSTEGLGYFLVQQKSALNIPAMFAAIIVMMAFGLINHAIFSYLERRYLYWSRARSNT
jgi:NitT/TauT family transport system permease protein